MRRWSPDWQQVVRNVVVLPVVWRENAAQALNEIVDHIAQFDEGAADRLEAQALDCSRNLPHFPHAYRAGRVEGTREAVFHPNYILVYRVGESMIEIINVMHTRRLYPAD